MQSAMYESIHYALVKARCESSAGLCFGSQLCSEAVYMALFTQNQHIIPNMRREED